MGKEVDQPKKRRQNYFTTKDTKFTKKTKNKDRFITSFQPICLLLFLVPLVVQIALVFDSGWGF